MTRSVLILAGGGSRRLGRDKMWVDIGGSPVVARVIDSARRAPGGATPDILVSVREAAPFQERCAADPDGVFAGIRLVTDDVPDAGPVAGLAEGLAAARGDVVVVLAGDLPFVSADLIGGLFEALEGAPDTDVIVPTLRGRDQVLCAAYRAGLATRAADLMAGVKATGDTGGSGPAGPRVDALFAGLNVCRVDSIAGRGPEELAVECRGIDTPADLAWARERVARG